MANTIDIRELSRSRSGISASIAETWRTGWDKALIVAVAAMAVFMLLRPFLLPVEHGDHYVVLAENMAQGRLTVNGIPNDYPDVVRVNGEAYLPFGPLPAVLLVPFLPLMHLLGTRDEVWVGYLLTILNVVLLARVLAQIGVRGERRKWALLLFFGSTVYFSAAAVGTAWYLAHVVVTTFLLLAVSEALGKRRMLLVGLCVGLAGATRVTALLAVAFFLWLIWRDRESGHGGEEEKPRRFAHFAVQCGALALGVAVPVLLLAAYNYARFGSPMESGYGFAVLTQGFLIEARAQGEFSLVHLPKNLFMFLLQGPLPYPSENAPVLQPPYIQPSKWGMGLLFTSPALIYALQVKLRRPLVQACWLAVLCIALPIFMYYGIGWAQFGYRYALDFLPFLLLVAALGLPQPLTRTARVLILVGVVVNIWGTVWLAKWVS